jgi:hypothetical protein
LREGEFVLMGQDEIIKRLAEEVIISEACLTGVFWNNPELYSFYPEEKINRSNYLNEGWGFFFGLGRYMQEKGVVKFDDISVTRFINELNAKERYDYYGGFEAIKEVMSEVRGKAENLDSFYDDMKKYNLLTNLTELIGSKVLDNNGKYNYMKMSKDQIFTYWNDKIIKLGMDGDSRYDEHQLLEGLEDALVEWDTNPAVGLEFYRSKAMTKICTGWDYGHVYMYGGFGGSGKSSFTFAKVIMSCLEKKEKLLVIANEQSVEEWKKMLITTALGQLGKEYYVNRQRINEGNYTEEEKRRYKAAIEWVRTLTEGTEKLITFVFMENYVMDNVKNLVRYYANRGIRRVIIDTGKPSEGDSSMARWERFTEDMKEIYKLARPNGGGLNLAIWVTIQLADSALNHRFLDYYALGDSKKIKNEASVLFLGRHIFDDEFSGGKNELKVTYTRYEPENPLAHNSFVTVNVKLERGRTYYLLFTGKNRRGMDNRTGQKVLVFQVDFNTNTWYEIGTTYVFDDKNY